MFQSNKNKLLIKRSFITLVLVYIVQYFFIAAPKAYAVIEFEPVYEVLQHTSVANSTGAQVKEIWETLINITNYLIIAVLIFVAFAQILRLNVSTYGIKKILPSLILAIIGANFSFLFCRLLVDLANILIGFLVHRPDSDVLANNFRGTWSDPSSWTPALKESDVGRILWFMVTQLFVIAGGFIVLALSYLFFIRIWLIYFLVALSPIAFMSTVLPQTKSVFTQWMSNFAKWVFLPVVSIFWIWLGNKWLNNVDKNNDFVMSYVFAGICYYLAITTPFKMGGAVMTAWGNIGKQFTSKPANWAWGKAKEKWVNPMIDDWKVRTNNWLKGQGSPNSGAFSKLTKGNKYNPLGMWMRRAKYVEWSRGKHKEEEEGWDDQLTREALGGREDQFRSKAWREKTGKYLDHIRGLYGEKDFAEKHLLREFLETEEGGQGVDRSIQYQKRMLNEENKMKTLEKISTAYAEHRIEGSNRYHDNPWFSKMWEEERKSAEALIMWERTGGKYEGDAMTNDKTNASHLHKTLIEHQKDLKELNEILADESLSDDEKEEWKELAREGYEDYVENFSAQVSGMFQDGLIDKQGNITGAAAWVKEMIGGKDGKIAGHYDETKKVFVLDDAKALMQNARPLTQILNVAEQHEKMFNSRIVKDLSQRIEEEIGKVAGKRSADESVAEMQVLRGQYGEEAYMNFIRQDYNKINGEALRKFAAEYANATRKAGSINNPEWGTIHGSIGELQATVAGQDYYKGKKARDDLGKVIGDSVAKGVATPRFLSDTEAAVRHAIKQEAGITNDDQVSEHIKKMQQDDLEGYNKLLVKEFKNLMHTSLRIDRDALDKFVNITVDEKGTIQANALNGLDEDNIKGMDEKAVKALIKEHSEFMKEINERIVNVVYRDPLGSGFKNAYDAAFKMTDVISRREVGKEAKKQAEEKSLRNKIKAIKKARASQGEEE